MRSIAVLTSPEVPIPAKGLAIIKSLPCETTVCVPDDAIEAMKRAEACFVWDTDLTGYIESNWRAFAHLEWMHVAVTGVDSFLFPSLVESDVTMTNAAGIYNDSIAEFVSFCVLSQSKRSRLLEAQQQKHAWSHATSTAVKHSNAVIYGVGSIGRTVGRMLAGLGMNVRGIDPYTNVAEGFECIYRTEEMNEAASWADHFIICAPLTEQTRHSVNSGVFKAMKPTCHLVNVGRGPIVDERSLIEAIESGQIGSASLDAFEKEPLPADSPLWDMDNVRITPHISEDAGDFELALIHQFADLADLWLDGKSFPLIVDKREGYAVRAA